MLSALQIHPETHSFLCKGFKDYGKDVWHDHFKAGKERGGVAERNVAFKNVMGRILGGVGYVYVCRCVCVCVFVCACVHAYMIYV